MEQIHTNLFAGWIGMLAGVVSGALIGMFFHKEAWLGGYGAWRRRMLRLGHISFFGIGFLNILFALTLRAVAVTSPWREIGSIALIVGAVTMPLCCFLCVWREGFRRVFFVPVLAVAIGILCILLGWSGTV